MRVERGLGMQTNTHDTMVLKVNAIDIGARIRREVEAQHWSYTAFARAINCSRSSLYNIFNSSDISLARLMQICKVLNVDFIGEIYSFDQLPDIHDRGDAAFISIPMTDGKFDLSKIPGPLLMLLRAEIDSDPRMPLSEI